MPGRGIEDRSTYPQLSDAQLEAMRGLLGRTSRSEARPPETLESIYDARNGSIIGCTDLSGLNALIGAISDVKTLPPNGDVPNRPIIPLDRTMLGRLITVGGLYARLHARTACLLRLARTMDSCLSRPLHNRFPRDFFRLVELLVEIGDELIRRTRKPYKTGGGSDAIPPVDPGLLLIEPLPNYHFWKSLLDSRSGKAILLDPIPLNEAAFSVDDKHAWQQSLDDLEQTLEAAAAKARIVAAGAGGSAISGALQTLKELTFGDIERDTRARFSPFWRDESVSSHVELIIYNSVYSVLLDAKGEPVQIGGIAPYSLLISQPGDALVRNFHSSGLYLSFGRLADYQFAVSGKQVRTLLLGGIVSFTRTESSFRFQHYLQERLQRHVENQGMHAIAAVTVPEAFGSPDLSLNAIRRAMSELTAGMKQYLPAALFQRLERLIENYDEVLARVGKQVVRAIVEDAISDWCKRWLIRKIGKKIIPVINLISAVANVFDDEENELIRAMVGCVVMVAKSRRPDDLTISSKILTNIALDKVQEEVVKQLVARGGKLAKVPRKPPAGEPGAKGKAVAAPEPQDVPSREPRQDISAKQPASPPVGQGKRRTGAASMQQIEQEMRLAQQAQLQGDAARQAAQRQSPRPEAAPVRPAAEGSDVTRPKTAGADAAVADKANVDRRMGDRLAAGEPRPSATPGEPSIDATATHGRHSRDHDPDPASVRTRRVENRETEAPKPERPKEPPLPPNQIPWRDRWELYQKHRKDYPPHVQGLLDAEPSKTEQARIDRAIRDDYADKLTERWGIPIKRIERMSAKRTKMPPLPSKNGSSKAKWKFYDRHQEDYPPHIRAMLARMKNRSPEQADEVEKAIREHHASQPREDTSGADWEKTNIDQRTGERPTLSATSTTLDGEEVQIDDFNPETRVAREYKASLEIAGKDPTLAEHELEQRMEKQARFAEDRGLVAYEWVAHSKDSYKKMSDALGKLRTAATTGDEQSKAKLPDRFKKISIVYEPILDK